MSSKEALSVQGRAIVDGWIKLQEYLRESNDENSFFFDSAIVQVMQQVDTEDDEFILRMAKRLRKTLPYPISLDKSIVEFLEGHGSMYAKKKAINSVELASLLASALHQLLEFYMCCNEISLINTDEEDKRTHLKSFLECTYGVNSIQSQLCTKLFSLPITFPICSNEESTEFIDERTTHTEMRANTMLLEKFTNNKPSNLQLNLDAPYEIEENVSLTNDQFADNGCIVEEILSSSAICDAYDFEASFAWLTTLMRSNNEANEDQVIYDTDGSDTAVAHHLSSPKKRLKRSVERDKETANQRCKDPIYNQTATSEVIQSVDHHYLLCKSWYCFSEMLSSEPRLMKRMTSKIKLKFISAIQQSTSNTIVYEICIPMDLLRHHVEGNNTMDENELDSLDMTTNHPLLKTYYGQAYDLTQAIWTVEIMLLVYFVSCSTNASSFPLSKLLRNGNYAQLQALYNNKSTAFMHSPIDRRNDKEQNVWEFAISNPIEYYLQLGTQISKLAQNPLILETKDFAESIHYLDMAVQMFDQLYFDPYTFQFASLLDLSHSFSSIAINQANALTMKRQVNKIKADYINFIEDEFQLNTDITLTNDTRLWKIVKRMLEKEKSLHNLKHTCLQVFHDTSWNIMKSLKNGGENGDTYDDNYLVVVELLPPPLEDEKEIKKTILHVNEDIQEVAVEASSSTIMEPQIQASLNGKNKRKRRTENVNEKVDDEYDKDEDSIPISSPPSTPPAKRKTSNKKQKLNTKENVAPVMAVPPPSPSTNLALLPIDRMKNIGKSRALKLYQFHYQSVVDQSITVVCQSESCPLKYIQVRSAKYLLNITNKQYRIQKTFASLTTIIPIVEMMIILLQPCITLQDLLKTGNYLAIQSFARSVIAAQQQQQDVDLAAPETGPELPVQALLEHTVIPFLDHIFFLNPIEYYLQLGYGLYYFQQFPAHYLSHFVSFVKKDSDYENHSKDEEVLKMLDILEKIIKSYHAIVINKEIALSYPPPDVTRTKGAAHDEQGDKNIQVRLSYAWEQLYQQCNQSDWKGTSLENLHLSFSDLFPSNVVAAAASSTSSSSSSSPLPWIYPPSHDKCITLTSMN